MYMYYYSFNAMYSVHPAFRTKKKIEYIEKIQLITYMYGNPTNSVLTHLTCMIIHYR